MKIGFDSDKYLKEQTEYILQRVDDYDKLYLEFGGKLFNDMHAMRILPGFDENVKVKLLKRLKEKSEVIICIYAGDIERNKTNGNLGITYDLEVFKLIDDFRNNDIPVNSVVITRYTEQPSADVFINKLQRRGIKTYCHTPTKGYPSDVDTIVSEAGYGQNPYIETTKPIVVVTAPGPGNGKLATCLNQLYHESVRGNSAGYSKFETFPVWNLPLQHPVNVAYEAATVDLKDINMIDHFHFDAHAEVAVNYNRDIETFPVLKRMIERITGKASVYQSPTDMGVNRISCGIVDDAVVSEAARQEVIRRMFKSAVEYKRGMLDSEGYERAKMLMENLQLTEDDRRVVPVARAKADQIKQQLKREVVPVVAIELPDGTIVTGKGSKLMRAAAAATINALKYLANISDDIHLLSRVILEPIGHLKCNVLGKPAETLGLEEILIALSISAATNPTAQAAFNCIGQLKYAQVHATTILNNSDEETLRGLGAQVTCDPEYASESLYYNL